MENDEFDSDSSDEDYIPDGKAEEAVSEVESDGDPEEPQSDSDEETGKTVKKGRKRKKKLSKSQKKAKMEQEKDDINEVETEKSKLTDQEKKQNADDLWADFMKDTGFKPRNARVESSSSKPKTLQSSSKLVTEEKDSKPGEKAPDKLKITQIFEYAGEEVKVEKEVDANSAEARLLSKQKSNTETSRPTKAGGLSGIGNVLSQLGKKQKISTLEKTKLDWDNFKKDENIEEELQTYNKGKDGYLERQDFLQRADLRRFEIEKNIRNVERAKRFNSTL